jgi:hypothetical protein
MQIQQQNMMAQQQQLQNIMASQQQVRYQSNPIKYRNFSPLPLLKTKLFYNQGPVRYR